jgi:hypothetical protein
LGVRNAKGAIGTTLHLGKAVCVRLSRTSARFLSSSYRGELLSPVNDCKEKPSNAIISKGLRTSIMLSYGHFQPVGEIQLTSSQELSAYIHRIVKNGARTLDHRCQWTLVMQGN